MWKGIALLLLTAASAGAQDAPHAQDTVIAFHAALLRGDRTAVINSLSPDVVIFESGESEMSRDEYSGHHLAADIEFVAATKEEVVQRTAGEAGDVAWVLTRSRTKGTFHGRPVDVEGTETMLLRRSSDGWRIAHIHWSSHAVRK